MKPLVERIDHPQDAFNVFRALAHRRYPFFLDSACRHMDYGHYSILGHDPFLTFRSKRSNVFLEMPDGTVRTFSSDPLSALDELLKRYRMDWHSGKLPFGSGLVGYFSYDLKDTIERLPDIAFDDLGVPDITASFYDICVIYDNFKSDAYIVSSGFPENERRKRLRRQKDRIKELKEIIRGPWQYQDEGSPSKHMNLSSNFTVESYIDAVERAKDYISKGNIYQVNLSQRFASRLQSGAPVLYGSLRKASPAPFSAYLDTGDLKILSSSPERFILKRGAYIETRPIKGTRPRSDEPSRDEALKRELSISSKDRAEHIMIVDLERNDIGRVCEYGSVRPVRLFELEAYSNVFHLVSTVSGQLRDGMNAIDCLRATFPGGSITGAPKIRAMEIIEELEPVKRSVYTGAIGYISFNGDMDTSIAIRTFLIKEDSVYFHVGGGIVADSVPEDEYDETIHKAKGLMRALGFSETEYAELLAPRQAH